MNEQSKTLNQERLINLRNGNINLGGNNYIIPHMPIKKSIINNLTPTLRDMKTGYVWYDFKNIHYKKQNINLSVCCYNNLVKSIQVLPKHKELHTNGTWKNWSEKREMENLQYYEDWLETEIGNIKNYSWGKISCQFDKRSGSSSITINYSEQK